MFFGYLCYSVNLLKTWEAGPPRPLVDEQRICKTKLVPNMVNFKLQKESNHIVFMGYD